MDERDAKLEAIEARVSELTAHLAATRGLVERLLAELLFPHQPEVQERHLKGIEADEQIQPWRSISEIDAMLASDLAFRAQKIQHPILERVRQRVGLPRTPSNGP